MAFKEGQLTICNIVKLVIKQNSKIVVSASSSRCSNSSSN
jgi:hypothetical protein